MKKIVTLLLSLILVGMLGVAMAESADIVEVAPGETLELDVVLTTGGGEAAKIGIKTNEAPVSFVSAVGGSANDTVPPQSLEGYFVVINADGLEIDETGSTMTGTSYTVKELEAGNVGKLTFKVNEEAVEGEHTVEMVVAAGTCSVNSKITFKITGEVVLLGDVNGDGKIDGRDTVRLLRALLGDDIAYVFKNSDMNQDGKLDGRDSIRLLKLLLELSQATAAEAAV